MRFGNFEVIVCRADDIDNPFQETTIGDKTYVHAMPDVDYKVHVRIAPGCENVIDGKIVKAELYVDGQSTNYYIKLNRNKYATFDSIWEDRKKFMFTFAFPDIIEGTEEQKQQYHSKGATAGNWRVKISEGKYRPRTSASEYPKLDVNYRGETLEGKKFHKQPTLVTIGGKFEPLPDHAKQSTGKILCTTKVLQECILYYHVPSAIRLLQLEYMQEQHQELNDDEDDFQWNTSSLSKTKREEEEHTSSPSPKKMKKQKIEVIDLTI